MGNAVKTMTPIHPEALATKSPVDFTPRKPSTQLRNEPTPANRPPDAGADGLAQQRLGGGAFGEAPAFEKQGPGRLAS